MCDDRSMRRRRRPGRRELIERKHQLAGEITALSNEIRRRQARGQPSGDLDRRLEQLRSRHYQTRLDIDRAGFDDEIG